MSVEVGTLSRVDPRVVGASHGHRGRAADVADGSLKRMLSSVRNGESRRGEHAEGVDAVGPSATVDRRQKQ